MRTLINPGAISHDRFANLGHPNEVTCVYFALAPGEVAEPGFFRYLRGTAPAAGQVDVGILKAIPGLIGGTIPNIPGPIPADIVWSSGAQPCPPATRGDGALDGWTVVPFPPGFKFSGDPLGSGFFACIHATDPNVDFSYGHSGPRSALGINICGVNMPFPLSAITAADWADPLRVKDHQAGPVISIF